VDFSPDFLRRIERVEERLNQADRELAKVSSEVTILRDEFHRRVTELKSDLLLKSDDQKESIRERVETLRRDINDSIDQISASMRLINDAVSQTTESIQNLHAVQNRSVVKVNTNEKIIWAMIGLVTTILLYIVQEFIKQ
jgi:ribosome recycling factor